MPEAGTIKKITYVIGDINGRGEMLDALVSHLRACAAQLDVTPRFCFLGNMFYVGGYSEKVVDVVSDVLATLPKSTFIMGQDDYLLCVGAQGRGD